LKSRLGGLFMMREAILAKIIHDEVG